MSGEHVLVASTGANEIVSFALADGAPLSRFGAVAQSLEAHLERRFRGSPGAPRQLNWPKAVAADRDRVYVADSANHCVKIFEAGVLIDSWGGRGAADGLFEFPGGIGVYDGHVFVAEARGRRVQAFSLSGRFVAKMRPAGCGDLAGLSVDAQHVYVADESESCVWLLPRVGPRAFSTPRGRLRVGSPIGRPCDFVVAFIRSNVPSPTVVFRHFRQSGSFDVLYGLPVVRLEIYRRKRYTVFAEGYNGRGFTMVEDHLKQTQRLYEVIVRSAFLYEVPVQVPCSASRSTTCTEVPVRRSQPRCESSLQ